MSRPRRRARVGVLMRIPYAQGTMVERRLSNGKANAWSSVMGGWSWYNRFMANLLMLTPEQAAMFEERFGRAGRSFANLMIISAGFGQVAANLVLVALAFGAFVGVAIAVFAGIVSPIYKIAAAGREIDPLVASSLQGLGLLVLLCVLLKIADHWVIRPIQERGLAKRTQPCETTVAYAEDDPLC